MSAKKVATEVFNESGIETEWFDCREELECDLPTDGTQFRLLIQPSVENLVKNRSQARKLTENKVLGFAMPCKMTDRACLFYIFYSPISSLATQSDTSIGCVLGQVIVHELGHALLGTDAHSRTGIMQPVFPIDGMGRFLYFSSSQSKRARYSLRWKELISPVHPHAQFDLP
jgi:hypothetical protein